MPKAKAKTAPKETKKVVKKREVEAPAPKIAEAPKPEIAKPAVHAPEAAAKHAVHAAPEPHVHAAPRVEPAKKEKPKPEVAFFGTGRRKTSIARVTVMPGSGNIKINGKPMIKYLAGRKVLEDIVTRPLIVTDSKAKFDVVAKVIGGGVVGQAGAVSHGIARALLDAGPDFRAKLKPEGLLTRDPRMKERKKYGRKKARKRFQYSKR